MKELIDNFTKALANYENFVGEENTLNTTLVSPILKAANLPSVSGDMVIVFDATGLWIYKSPHKYEDHQFSFWHPYKDGYLELIYSHEFDHVPVDDWCSQRGFKTASITEDDLYKFMDGAKYIDNKLYLSEALQKPSKCISAFARFIYKNVPGLDQYFPKDVVSTCSEIAFENLEKEGSILVRFNKDSLYYNHNSAFYNTVISQKEYNELIHLLITSNASLESRNCIAVFRHNDIYRTVYLSDWKRSLIAQLED